MIDWLTMQVPCSHDAAITGGHVISIEPSGEVAWCSVKRMTVAGSYSTGLQLRTATHTADPCTFIEISGNPVKFFQGHNLWGTNDVHALVLATIERVVDTLGLTPSAEDRAAWLAGDVQITRIDCTETFHLRNLPEVLAWLRAAEQTSHLAHRGRGQLVKGSTLYFGKNSRRWSLKLYAKGQEVRAKGHGQDSILHLPSAMEWADRALRAELTVRSLELKRLGLDHVRDWIPVDGVPFPVTEQLLRERLGAMTMTTSATLSDEARDSLTNSQRLAYSAWAAGEDLRAALSRGGFYNLRNKLLPHGIDIATVLPREVSNVVPLYRVLEAKPVGIPDWAQGTPLYFEPLRVA